MMRKILYIHLLLISNYLAAQQGITPIVPFNNDTLETKYPMFSWFISDVGSGRGSFKFIISEINENQSAEEAINSNASFFRIENYTGTQLMYSLDAPEIEYNKWYAWQVQRFEGNYLSDKSEAWKFILYKPEPKKVKYIQLQEILDASIHEIKDGTLYFKLNEYYESKFLNMKIYNSKMEEVALSAIVDSEGDPISGLTNLKKTGTNLYEMNVSSLRADEIYTIVIDLAKGKNLQAKFKLN